MRILIVDDEKDIGSLICGILNQLEMDCERVFTIEQAREHISSQSFDIYFIDVNLPDGSGFDLVSGYIDEENRGDVVIISAIYDEDEMNAAKKLGIDKFLQKPFSKREILRTINGMNTDEKNTDS